MYKVKTETVNFLWFLLFFCLFVPVLHFHLHVASLAPFMFSNRCSLTPSLYMCTLIRHICNSDRLAITMFCQENVRKFFDSKCGSSSIMSLDKIYQCLQLCVSVCVCVYP